MLHVPGGAFSFAAIQTNLPGQPLATGGTAVTPVVGSKGNWAVVFAALDNDTFGLIVQVQNSRTSAANRTYVVDVGIGGAGSEQVIIPDVIGSNAVPNNGIGGGGLWYYFPIFIPAGTRIAVRAQGNVTTSCRVIVKAMQQPANPSMVKTCGHVEKIGLTGITGTSVTSGTTSEGSWTLLGTTSRDLWWWQLGVQVPVADTVHVLAVSHWDVAVGNGTNFQMIMQDVIFQTSTTEEAGKPLHVLGCEAFVPSGASIYVRAQADVTPDPFEAAVYGAG